MKRRSAIVAILLLAAVLLATGCAATPQAGQIGVVREGKSFIAPWSWLNGHKVTKTICPGSGYTVTGFGSQTHFYPDEEVQRNYTITSEANQGDKKGSDVVEVPTQDGVRAGIEGTFYFKTAFNCTKAGQKLLRDFDERFGIRTFKETNESEGLYPYEGESGWRAYLSQVVRPVINNDLRKSIATVTCPQLVSSCALVHNNSIGTNVTNQNNNSNIAKVQEDINQTLKTDIQSTLGADYFSNISFLLEHVTLPGQIQGQIDNAQAQYAAVGAAKAKVEQADQEALANEKRQQGYAHCPACAQIDELKAIPNSVQTFAPGAGFAVTGH